ncbi:MAG: nodulation protein NodU [Clostridia bacterium]|nr:nodulation protein NodU [Clostridia bacterium]
MKEGYYISAFVCIDELQNILDIKIRHDQTIALWRYKDNEIELLRYWELERISGIKMHPKAFYNKEAFFLLLEDLLKEESITLSDIEAIWGTPEIETDISYRDWVDERFAFHSFAHLLTAVCFENKSPLDSTILAMALDAGPDSKFEPDAYEKLYYSACVIKDGNVEYFSVESPARLWSYSYKKFGLREGTLMALANAIDVACDVDEDTMDRWLSYEFIDESTRDHSQKIVNEITGYVDNYLTSNPVEFDDRFSVEDNKLSMIMKIVSELSLRIVYRNIDNAIAKFGLAPEETIIALAGGFALNCPTNSAILEKYRFKSFQIPPCATDTGIAMGIGLGGFYKLIFEEGVKVNLLSAYYGEGCGDYTILKEKYPNDIAAIKEVSMTKFAELLESGEILIWVNGKAEIGPRALGNRSLIGDSRSLAIKDKLNVIKKRQWWRPVAPIIMDEYGKTYFKNYRSTYNMLLNLFTKEEMVAKIPAVVHHDNSARVQSVSSRSNSTLYELLSEFNKLTGVPVLCNTSLNDAGEPIINHIEEAIKFAKNKGLKYICVEGRYLIEMNHEKHISGNDEKKFALRSMKYFNVPSQVNIEEVIKEKNPHRLDLECLTYYFDNPNIFKDMSLLSYEDAQRIQEKTDAYVGKYKFALLR